MFILDNIHWTTTRVNRIDQARLELLIEPVHRVHQRRTKENDMRARLIEILHLLLCYDVCELNDKELNALVNKIKHLIKKK